jgi:hypothetical protein
MLDGHANQIAGPRPALRQMSGLPASQGAWIFVSHSNRDFDKVRHVRDTLESAGHRPLLFFLKSLDDDSEIDGLIKAEIDAREWFILCDSANSRASNWVGREVAYIRTLGDKVYTEIDLDDQPAAQSSKALLLARRASVFPIYARADSDAAAYIADLLLAHDFGVFRDLDLASSDDWRANTEDALLDAARRGWVIILLSPDALRSEFVIAELYRALGVRGVNLLPIIVRDVETTLAGFPPDVRDALLHAEWLDFTPANRERNTPRLLATLRRRSMV